MAKSLRQMLQKEPDQHGCRLNKAERVCGRRACLGPLKARWLPPSVSLEAIGGFGAET